MKKKLLLFAVAAISTAAVNAQYCSGGPTSTIDSNLETADLIGETSSISYVGCPGVTGVENALVEVADLTIDGDYSVDLHWGTCGGSYNWAGSAWIDYDGSGSYEPDELIADQTGFGDVGTFTYDFTVPGDAVEGTTRMRVVQRESGSLPLDPCASFSWGSSVEFTIELIPGCEALTVDVSSIENCEGDEVTLTATSGTGGTISWDMGVENGVPFEPGAPGTYTYTPTSDSEDDCVAEPVEVVVIGLPVVLAGAGDLVFCEDESITLSSAGDADLYIWNDGDDLDLMPGVGTYTFELTGFYTEGGCLGENTDEVTVEVVALPTITGTASDDPICVNLEVTLNGSGGETYWWDNDVIDGEPFIPATLGTTTYTVFGTDENGCSNTGTVDVEVVDNIVISVAGIMIETVGDDGEIDIEVSGGAPAYDYDWDNDGAGEFGDTQDLTGLAGGMYTVVIRDEAGCETERTFNLKSQVGIDDLTAENVAVYPNPTTEFVNIEFTGTFQYELVAINGDVLLIGTATDKEVLLLDTFANGVYFINLKNETATTTVKIVKK